MSRWVEGQVDTWHTAIIQSARAYCTCSHKLRSGQLTDPQPGRAQTSAALLTEHREGHPWHCNASRMGTLLFLVKACSVSAVVGHYLINGCAVM